MTARNPRLRARKRPENTGKSPRRGGDAPRRKAAPTRLRARRAAASRSSRRARAGRAARQAPRRRALSWGIRKPSRNTLARLNRLLDATPSGAPPSDQQTLSAFLAIREQTPRSGRPAGAFAILPAGDGLAETGGYGATARAKSGDNRPIVPAESLQAAARRIQAVASSVRLKILVHLLAGPSTYAHLKKATSLAAGPLYFHLGRLRLAGLIGPAERNLYVLTKEGRIFLAGILLIEAVLSKR